MVPRIDPSRLTMARPRLSKLVGSRTHTIATGRDTVTAFTLAHLSDPHLRRCRSRDCRTGGQTRARLPQLGAKPPEISFARRARRADGRHAGAVAGPHRGDRRSGQPRAGRGVCAGAGLARKRRRPAATSRSCPAITMPMSAQPGLAPPRWSDFCVATTQRDGPQFPFVRRRGPLALIGIVGACRPRRSWRPAGSGARNSMRSIRCWPP